MAEMHRILSFLHWLHDVDRIARGNSYRVEEDVSDLSLEPLESFGSRCHVSVFT